MGTKMPRILVTGKNGQVGFELQRSFAALGEVIAVGRSEFDLGRPEAIDDLIKQVAPDIIINSAAYTAVDRAECDVANAFAINSAAPEHFAQAASRAGALLVHYSTDYVFDGTKTAPYSESDQTNPQSVYGRSKCDGEAAVLASPAKTLVLRTSWVAGQHGSNFAKTILRLASERTALRVVADQYGAPTTASLIADVTAQIVGRFWIYGDKSRFPGGLYHLTAAGEASWHEYACEVVRFAKARGVPLKTTPDTIEAVEAWAYPLPAPRPVNSILDTRKLQETFGIRLPEWRQGIHYLLEQILP